MTRKELEKKIKFISPTYFNEIMLAIDEYTEGILDSIEQSCESHTVPEGEHLMTKSYLRNTLEFELNRLRQK